MTANTWPDGAVTDAIELMNMGVKPLKVMQFLQRRFPDYRWTHQLVKSFMDRARGRGNLPPRVNKWTEKVSQRAQELVRQGLGRVLLTRALNDEFAPLKFYPNDVINHIGKVRRNTGDATLKFAVRAVPTERTDQVVNLAKTTELNTREIAAKLGLTKGAVSGILLRARLKSGDETIRSQGKRQDLRNQPVHKVAKRNSGAIVSSLKSSDTRRRKSERFVAAREIMRNHITCSGDACHFTKRPDYGSYFHTHCCWPVYPDDAAYSDKNSCCNPVEKGKPYCAAHQKRATEYVPGGFTDKALPVRKGAIPINSWKRAAA